MNEKSKLDILKEHVVCVIVGAIIVIMAVAVVAWQTQAAALSLSASIVSIVLAVVVIIYTFYQTERSARTAEQVKENLRDTTEAISSISRDTLTVKAHTEALLSQSGKTKKLEKDDVFKPGEGLDFDKLHVTDAIVAREKQISQALRDKDSEDKIAYLIRSYVGIESKYYFEIAIQQIYGSQLLLLEKLEKSPQGISEQNIKHHYAIAVAKNTDLHSDRTYEVYMDFLQIKAYVLKKDDVWVITTLGLDFLEYLRACGFLETVRKHGG